MASFYNALFGREDTKLYDTIVVGGGIFGTSILYHLSTHAGHKCALLERGAIGSGATAMSAGTIACLMNPQEENSTDTKPFMLLSTVKTIQEIKQKYGIDTSFVQSGGYTVATTDESLGSLRHTFLEEQKQGYISRWLTADELQKEQPIFTTNCLSAIHYPLSGQVDPNVLVGAIAKAAKLNGADIMEGENVEKISGRLLGYFDGYHYKINTENGQDYLARNVVEATGTEDKYSLPVKGHIITGEAMKDPNGNPVTNLIYYCNDAYNEWNKCKPEQKYLSTNQKPAHIYGKFIDGRIMLGGGRAVCDKYDYDIDPKEVAAIRAKISSLIRGVDDFKPEQTWSGVMPFSYDREWRLNRNGNIWTANGLASSGIMYGPGLAKYIAQWIVFNDKPKELDF